MLKTTSSTLDEFKQEVPWELLPKTFQNTIRFLRSLDIDYLWIDSLCIVQATFESPGDWEEQSGKMSDIYSNALVTIAAARAADSSGGLFAPTRRSMVREGTRVLVTPPVDHFQPPDLNLENFPLFSRGWVTQEMMLSPRVLEFCDGDLVGECMEHNQCTCWGTSFTTGKMKNPIWGSRFDPPRIQDVEGSAPSTTKSHDGLLLSVSPQSQISSLKPPQTSASAADFQAWQRMVEHYSDGKPNFAKDRLPAVSGLARRFFERYSATYAAGRWREYVAGGLLWTSDRCDPPPSPDEILPTWSWTYVQRRVRFSHFHDGSKFEYFAIQHLECVPQSPHNPFGRLQSARLVVSGRLMPLVLEYDANKRSWAFEYQGHENFLFFSNFPPSSPKGTSSYDLHVFGFPILRDNSAIEGLLISLEGDAGYQRIGRWVKNQVTAGDQVKVDKLHALIRSLPMQVIELV